MDKMDYCASIRNIEEALKLGNTKASPKQHAAAPPCSAALCSVQPRHCTIQAPHARGPGTMRGRR